MRAILAFHPDQPFNQLPRLPPAGQMETATVLKQLVPAARELAKLSALAQELPNPGVLTDSVTLLEAKASSEIEHIITTNQELFIDGDISPDGVMTKEVKRYAHSLRAGLNYIASRPMDTPLAEEICSSIKSSHMTVRKVPSTSLKNTATGQIVYTPPVGEALLRDLLANLFQWLHDDDDTDKLIKAAILHHQFVAIHSFTDGNGRTARILTVLYLVEQDLLTSPALFLSGEILNQRDSYYRVIQNATESGELQGYLLWFLELIELTALHSQSRVLRIKNAMAQQAQMLEGLGRKLNTQQMINYLFSGPYLSAKQMVLYRAAGSIQTAYRYLNTLVKAGILAPLPSRTGRTRVYLNTEFWDALGTGQPI